ncbi:hypothetical protein QR685DRAFT_572114 [Neurospora intermedia]|uniref:Uncharacterized protein n=1 Tax=Neurospora intermedia TaxID=5142 RepID=A0ABR3DEK5_NEUIN
MTPSISCSSNRMDEAFWTRFGKCILVKAKVHQAVRDQIGGLVVDVLTERMAGSRGHLEEELESAGGVNRGNPPAVRHNNDAPMSNAALVSVLFTHLKTSRPLGEGIVVNATAANLYGHQDEILGYSKLDPHKPITARGQTKQRTGTRTQKGWASPWAK